MFFLGNLITPLEFVFFVSSNQLRNRNVVLVAAHKAERYLEVGVLHVVVALGILAVDPQTNRDLLGGHLVKVEKSGGIGINHRSAREIEGIETVDRARLVVLIDRGAV